MGKKTEVRGRPFPKGKSGNPQGLGILPAELRRLKRITQRELLHLYSILLTMTEGQIDAVLADPESVMLVKAFARCLKEVVSGELKSGSYNQFNEIMSRFVGRIPQTIVAEVTRVTPFTEADLPGFRVIARERLKKLKLKRQGQKLLATE